MGKGRRGRPSHRRKKASRRTPKNQPVIGNTAHAVRCCRIAVAKREGRTPLPLPSGRRELVPRKTARQKMADLSVRMAGARYSLENATAEFTLRMYIYKPASSDNKKVQKRIQDQLQKWIFAQKLTGGNLRSVKCSGKSEELDALERAYVLYVVAFAQLDALEGLQVRVRNELAMEEERQKVSV